MRKRMFMIVAICASLLIPAEISANIMNYEETIALYDQEDKAPQSFQIDDGAGGTVTAVAQNDTLYVTVKSAAIHSKPGEGGEEFAQILFGTDVKRVAVCDNGWSKVTVQKEDGAEISGYVPDSYLSDQTAVEKISDSVTAAQDCDILDFPGKKDGEVVGEILESDEVTRTGSVNGIWSRIVYEDISGSAREGFIPTNALEGYNEDTQMAQADTSTSDGTVEAGSIHKSSGEGIFADAVDGVTATSDGTAAAGVIEGTPVSVSSDAALKPLGMFRITHYCPCSICCGPWANGITSTGVTAVTNRTIAVDPSQIPYGSRVVINGQIYVAEDCGGAIKENCIDIYVGSHEEGESKGVFYTEVYLLED